VSNLTKAFAGIYLAALAICGALLLWTIFNLAAGYLMFGRPLPPPPLWPWLPIATLTMIAAKYAAGRSSRRDGL
jgi:hypothetical protein